MSNSSVRSYVILAAVDYSELSDLAVAQAFLLAKGQAQAEVHLINVARTAAVGVFVDSSEGVLAMTIEDAAQKLKAYAEAKVAQVADAGGLARVVTHIAFGAPPQQIAQLASDLEADILVLGTHGRRGVERILLGSVAEGVVRMAHCPVLVVRAPESTPRVPEIEPPCPVCLDVRRTSAGKDFWCPRHSEHHPRAHTYHFVPRNVAANHSNMPFVSPMKGEV